MNSIAGASGPKIVGEGNGEDERNELVEGDWDRERAVGLVGVAGSGTVRVDGVVFADELVGEVGSYTGGGTKLAFTRRLDDRPDPESRAACKSDAYRSWKVRRMLISMATARKSAAMPGRLGFWGTLTA
jgi:hypothetical protein